MNGPRNLRYTKAYHLTTDLLEQGEYLSPMQVKGQLTGDFRDNQTNTNAILQAIEDYEK